MLLAHIGGVPVEELVMSIAGACAAGVLLPLAAVFRVRERR